MILIEFLLAPTVPSAPEAEEHAAHDVVRLDVEVVVDRERQVRDIVHDADGEVALRLRLGQLVEDRLDHRRA